MNKCKTCEHAVYSLLWGEYKCSIKERVIFAPEMYKDCEDYKEGVPVGSKENTEYEASMED